MNVVASSDSTAWLDAIRWDASGLVPVVAQEQASGDVLMFAWMNREALQKTAELGRAVYFSRSRNKLWFKGEESGHVQTVHEIRIDCDQDVVLLKVTQIGHDPGISMLGAYLCGVPAFPPLRPGQVSLVEDGQPRWFIHPETLAVDRLLVGV